ncbi:hypothetical protein X566_19375 [Afipia sp. P52-10]|uniref:hypothetical protein n=1 Tax=Afipia sp. P52-10 TaxID=1429916 RepID=UPI0003DF4563|nr:hypothetical protein [Afipia sp. P52-10]ETR74949.1 hypothetical protein X566_19375 [Afipia sp. P52-10]
MSVEWKTKQGTRRVRVEPPTLEEAIFAAAGVTEVPQEQAEFAASLTGIPVETVLAQIQKEARKAARTGRVVAIPSGSQRAVVVERRPSRAAALRAKA